MTPLKLIRKIGRFIRGGAAPLLILIACLLGFLIGMTPGFNMTLVIGILLVVLLNVSMGLVLLSAALGKIASLALAPITFRVGYFVIHDIGLAGFFRAAGDTPAVALMDLHVYCLTGGLIVGAVIGGAYGVLMAAAVAKVRRGLLAIKEGSQAVANVLSFGLVRFLLRFLFGGKKSLAEAIGQRPRLLRKSGLIVTAAIALLVVGGSFLLTDRLVAGAIAEGIGRANGAQVDIDRAHLSVRAGRLSIEGLQVTDPDKPTHNVVQVDRLSGDVSLADLLAGRLVIDRLAVSGVKNDTPRDRPGRILPRWKPKTPESGPGAGQDILFDYFEHPEKYEKYLEYLRKLRRYLAERKRRRQEAEQKRRTDREWLDEIAANEGYFALSAQHILTRHPTVRVREIVVDQITWKDAPYLYRVEGREISSHPDLNPNPMQIRFGDRSAGPGGRAFGDKRRVFLDFGFHAQAAHRSEIRWADLALQQAPKLSGKVPLTIRQGKALIAAAGAFLADAMDLSVAVQLSDLKAAARQGKGILGLDAATSQRVFDSIRQFTLYANLYGTIDRPRVKIDERRTLESLKSSLMAAGKRELEQLVDGQLRTVTARLEAQLGGKLGEVSPGVLGDLLGGKRPGAADAPADPAKTAGDLIKKAAGGAIGDLLGGKKQAPATRPAGKKPKRKKGT